MAKIVDKNKKRREIALSCKELIVKNSISNITVFELAKAAQVGKGTIYEYFEKKEDIVFELTNILIQQNLQNIEKKINEVENIKDKLKILSSFYFDDESCELREIYKNFISITLVENDEDIRDFQKQSTEIYFEKFMEILDEGIKKGLLKNDAKQFARVIFNSGLGIFLQNVMANSQDEIKNQLEDLIDLFLKVASK